MQAKILLTTAVVILASGFGCSGLDQKRSRVEENWRIAYRAALEQQILEPETSRPVDEPVTGLHGKAAEKTMDKYTDSFKKKSDNKINGTITIK